MKSLTKVSVVTALCLTLLSASALADSQEKGMHGGQSDHKMHLARNVVAAVSQTGLTAKQAADVTDAVNAFKAKCMEQKASKSFPVDAFENGVFNAETFKREQQKQFDARTEAMTELFTRIYAILTPEQRPLFKRAFTAPMIEKMIKRNMIKGPMASGAKPGCNH